MGRVGLAAKCNLIQAAGPSSLSSFANIGLGPPTFAWCVSTQLDSGPLVVVWETGQWTPLLFGIQMERKATSFGLRGWLMLQPAIAKNLE